MNNIKKLNTLRNKYIKARKQLISFNKTVINQLDDDIRETSEFFDCEVTLIDLLDDKINLLGFKIEELEACNLTGLTPEL